jgi:hypothetical protein
MSWIRIFKQKKIVTWDRNEQNSRMDDKWCTVPCFSMALFHRNPTCPEQELKPNPEGGICDLQPKQHIPPQLWDDLGHWSFLPDMVLCSNKLIKMDHSTVTETYTVDHENYMAMN